MGDFLDVSERCLTMSEVCEAASEGRLLEVFGSGTAAVVSPVCAIGYRGVDIEVAATGPITKRMWDEVTGIQYGKTNDGPPGWSVVC
jgi:branched-chain amino acid aminotransferase